MENTRSERIKQLTLNLVRIQSDTGTHQEKDVEDYLHAWLGEHEYFRNNPDYFGWHPLPEDPVERCVVWGLIKGQGDLRLIPSHARNVPEK